MEEESPPPESPGEFNAEKAAETLQSVDQAVASLRRDTTIDQEERNLYGELKSVARAVSEVAGVDTVVVPDDRLTATAILESGITFVFSNNRPPGISATEKSEGETSSVKGGSESASARYSSGGSASRQSNSVSKPGLQEETTGSEPRFPESKKAVVNAFDGGGTQASQVRQYLSDAGYEISEAGVSRTDMRNKYKDIGVLYLDTHGALFNRMEAGSEGGLKDGTSRYALQTSTTTDITRKWVKANDTELKNGEIVMGNWCMIGPNCEESEGSGKDVAVAITGKFIEKHWSFSDNGFAYIHACRIGGPTVGGPEDGEYEGAKAVREAVLDAGARVMVGTEGDTEAGVLQESIYSTFEMMLPIARKKYGRPWNIGATASALREMELTEFEWYRGNAIAGIPTNPFRGQYRKTNVRFYGDLDVRLVPSIRHLEVTDAPDQSQGELRVKGAFPSSEGTLKMGGSDLSVQKWTQDEITADLPFEGESAIGPVRADDKEGLPSNIVNLTRWTGQVESVVKGPGSQRARSTMELAFRGDVHPIRESPAADPKPRKRVEAYVSPTSTGKIEGNGSYTGNSGAEVIWTGENSYDLIGKETIDQWYGNGPIEGGVKSSFRAEDPDRKADDYYGPDNSFGGKVAFNPREGTGWICLRVNGTITTETRGDEITLQKNFPGQAIFLASTAGSSTTTTDGTESTLGCVKTAFQGLPANPSLTRGSASSEQIIYGGYNLSMSWTAFQAENQPLPWTEW